MNRTIKFRGKHGITNQWVFGDFEHYNNGVSHISGIDYAEPVKEDTVGQFTGLIDRNGKEIYEDDIIELNFENDNSSVEIVGFRNGRFVTIDPLKPYRDEALCVFVKYTTVIGNIYDTPNLLNISTSQN